MLAPSFWRTRLPPGPHIRHDPLSPISLLTHPRSGERGYSEVVNITVALALGVEWPIFVRVVMDFLIPCHLNRRT
jgi:hypothetical protein